MQSSAGSLSEHSHASLRRGYKRPNSRLPADTGSVRDALVAHWVPGGPEPDIGTPVRDLVQTILEEEFGNSNFRYTLGSAILDGFGRWADSAEREFFEKGGLEAAKKIGKRIKGLFKGVRLGSTHRHFPKPLAVRDQYVCPISLEIMRDPVIALDGFTYERSLITRWLEHKDTSPMTAAVLPSKTVAPNTAIRQLIEAEAKARGFQTVVEWRSLIEAEAKAAGSRLLSNGKSR